MKKLIAILLSLTFVLSVSVFAATTSLGTTKQDVTATYQTSSSDSPVYSIDITWGSMAFIYSVNQGTWDPNTHTYKGSSGSWRCDNNANVITITNHSNADVECKLAFLPSYDSITGTLSQTSQTLPTAENKSTDTPSLTCTSTLTLDGPLESTTSSVIVGSVSVTLSASE